MSIFQFRRIDFFLYDEVSIPRMEHGSKCTKYHLFYMILYPRLQNQKENKVHENLLLKKPCRGKPVSVDTGEDVEMRKLKDRFVVYNLDDSLPDKVIESENDVTPTKKKVVRKRADEASKKVVSEMNSDDENDEKMKTIYEEETSDAEVLPSVEVHVGRKGKAPGKDVGSSKATKPAIDPRKRDPTKKLTLITDTSKPTENVGISPEKKVRKMRESPFKKKSCYIMGRIVEGSCSGEKTLTISEEQLNSSNEVLALVRRTVRANRSTTKYVLSDSDEPADEETDSNAVVDIDYDEDE